MLPLMVFKANMASIVFLLCLVVPAVIGAEQLSEVIGLRGEADYRFVRLRWEYPVLQQATSFQVHYCELQAWGPNRCRNKIIDDPVTGLKGSSPYRMHTVIISGLRMATNYSFEVWPQESRTTRYLKDNFFSRKILVTTKGFSARASLCLPEVSEVEVSTGPYFNGRIQVETGGDTAGCSVDGDQTSPQEVYTLRIQHRLCGSTVNQTSVSTFILVQENLPILTHSTRRFLVLCTFHPETLTVRAGLNLPSTSPGSVVGEPALMTELSNNEVHAAPLHQEQQDDYNNFTADETEAQVVLSTIAVVAGLVGICLTVWWFLPSKLSSGSESILSEECGSSVYDNYENSLRDDGESRELGESGAVLPQAEARNEMLTRESGVFTICQASSTPTIGISHA